MVQGVSVIASVSFVASVPFVASVSSLKRWDSGTVPLVEGLKMIWMLTYHIRKWKKF